MRKRKKNDNDEHIETEELSSDPSIGDNLAKHCSKVRGIKRSRTRNALSTKVVDKIEENHGISRRELSLLATTVNASSPNALHKLPCRQYWLLKAEPESRIVKGQDIKFSIDDLAAKTEPEPWDGIRNYAARNNLRAMKRGDLAFFYHSSCKEPAIVGIMEIVAEHAPDLSAHDPNAPYYDPKDNPANPRWSLVHVEFRQKLQVPITLKELKVWHAQKNHILSNIQLLRLARMSVSKVEEEEWKFLLAEMKKRGDDPKL